MNPGCKQWVSSEPCSLRLKVQSAVAKEHIDEVRQLRRAAEITCYLLFNFTFSLYIFITGNGGSDSDKSYDSHKT